MPEDLPLTDHMVLARERELAAGNMGTIMLLLGECTKRKLLRGLVIVGVVLFRGGFDLMSSRWWWRV